MGEIVRMDGMENHLEGHGDTPSQADIINITNDVLMDARSDLPEKALFSMPIAQITTLGAGVSPLIPALHTVTQTTSVNTQGLYRLANAGIGHGTETPGVRSSAPMVHPNSYSSSLRDH